MEIAGQWQGAKDLLCTQPAGPTDGHNDRAPGTSQKAHEGPQTECKGLCLPYNTEIEHYYSRGKKNILASRKRNLPCLAEAPVTPEEIQYKVIDNSLRLVF